MESLSLGQYVKLNCKVREPTVFKDDQEFKKILNIEFKEKKYFSFPRQPQLIGRFNVTEIYADLILGATRLKSKFLHDSPGIPPSILLLHMTP